MGRLFDSLSRERGNTARIRKRVDTREIIEISSLSLSFCRVDAKTTILTLFQRSFRFFNLSAVNRALTTGKRFEIRTICRRIRCAERVDRGTAVSHFVNMRINRHDFRANPHDDGEEI